MDIQTLIIITVLAATAALIVFASSGKSKVSGWKSKAALKLADLDTLISSNEINQMKVALSEADKLLDYVFKSKGLKGETMGERLKNSQKAFKWEDYQKIWEAHKLRNKLAHEMDFAPKNDEVKKAFIQLKKAINSQI